ncbi:MAG: MFS transporter, partial [Candidatus Thioglobus sp.]
MENTKFNLFSFQAEYKVLHLTWLAFFMSFMVWLSIGPMMPFIQEYFDLSKQQAQTLLILNIAMTIPARVIVGILVDHFGPKIIFSGILVLGGLVSIFFSWAQTYEQLAFMRFLSGFIGAGFVVGIRIIAEWFPANKNGTAQGIYGGFGNFGSAAAAIILPFLAVLWAENGWRIAITLISLMAIIYGIFYYFNISNTPKNSTYLKPKKSGVMEVNSLKDLILYSITNSFIYLALAIIV